MGKLAEEVAIALRWAAESMKQYYDEHRQNTPEYQPGDLVYLEGTHLKLDRPSKKLDDCCFGPFKVLQKVGERAYKLSLSHTWKWIHPTFHTVLLHPYTPPKSSLQQQPPPPPPVDLGGTPEFEVEEVLDSQMRRGRREFLVKWRGQPREENTWEPERNLKNEHGMNEAFQMFLKCEGNQSIKIRIPRLEDWIYSMPETQGVYDWRIGSFRKVWWGHRSWKGVLWWKQRIASLRD